MATGLERAAPQAGTALENVFARRAEHLCRAPADVPRLTVAGLARDPGIVLPGDESWWEPAHLPRLQELAPAGEPLALYGRGPVWLYVALAAHVAPAPFYLFDAGYYGWMTPPPVILDAGQAVQEFTLLAELEANDVHLCFMREEKRYVLRPLPVHVPLLAPDRRVILDGPMPIWLYAALARGPRRQPALAAYEPRGRIVTCWRAGKLSAA